LVATWPDGMHQYHPVHRWERCLHVMRCQQPFNVSARERDAAGLIAERVDGALDVRFNRPALCQEALTVLVILRLGAPGA
jgi:hypothetical protein